MMSVEENKRMVLHMLDCLSTWKSDEVLACMNDSATWVFEVVSDSLPQLQGPMSKTALSTQMKELSRVLPSGVRLVVTGVTAEGDRVAVEAQGHAVTARGKNYNNRYHFLFEMRAGKVQAIREYNDVLLVKEVVVEAL
jgi:uncharacterized protein